MMHHEYSGKHRLSAVVWVAILKKVKSEGNNIFCDFQNGEHINFKQIIGDKR